MMPKPTKKVEVERVELNRIKSALVKTEEAVIQMQNKLDAMNKYYARTITQFNSQIDFVNSAYKQIEELHKELVPQLEAIELTKPVETKRKATKKAVRKKK